MAFVGSLSGSLGTIAVTGSLVPVEVTNDLGATGSKWRTVFANNITGSLRNTAGGQDFISAGPNITANYNSSGQWEITGAAGGGGGAGVFTESGATAAFTTSSIAIGIAAAASTKGSDVFFAVSGSNPSSNTALFSGPVVASGSISVKEAGITVAQITGPGVISGSGLQTVGNLAVQGTSALTGDVTFGGNIVADANEAKSIFALVTSNAITVGGAGSSVDVAGNLKVSGNQISGSTGGNITLGAAGAVTVAGNLTVNGGLTGSLQKTTGGNNFIVAGPNVTANYNGLGQWEITGAAGGGAGVFTESSATAAFTTSSIAVGFGAAASTKGSDVFFAVSGSNTSSNTALFSGPIVTSGSFAVKDLANGNTVASITNAGAISGSALQTVGNLAVQGTSALIGDVTVTGDVAVNGGDITTSAATFNIAASAGTVNVGSSTGVVVIPGDLEVRGTTMTVSASNLVIEDPLVGFGFLTGSVAAGSTGDRGFVGGYTGAGNNVAFGYSLSNTAFVATKTTSSPEDSTITISALQPIRASKFEVNGTTAVVTSSDGSALLLSGSTMTMSGTNVALDTGTAVNFTRSGARVGQLIGTSGTEFKLAAMNSSGGATSLVLTGSGIELGANSAGINLSFVGTARGSISFNAGSSAVQLGTNAGVALSLSGSNGITLTHGAVGATFVKDTGAPPYLVVEGDGSDARLRAAADLVLRADGNDIKFNNGTQTVLTLNTAGNNADFQGASNQQVNIGSVGSGGMTVSGSTVIANTGPGGFVFQRDGVAELLVNLAGSTTTISGSTNQNVILAAGAGATTLTLSGSTVNNQATIAHRFNLGGTLISHVTASSGRQGFFPGADSTFDLGGPSIRWANIYTGDLHLRNERGDYTLIEESDFLSIRFNKNGKRYKFLLERVPELDER